MNWYYIYNEATNEYLDQLLATSCAAAEQEAARLYPQYADDGMYAICSDEF